MPYSPVLGHSPQTRRPKKLSLFLALLLVIAGSFSSANARLMNRQNVLQIAQDTKILLTLTAKLQEHTKQLEEGVSWYIFKAQRDAQGHYPFIGKYNKAVSHITLPTGKYLVTATYGQAYLTQKITLTPPKVRREVFILNAGGLSVNNDFETGFTVKKSRLHIDLYAGDTDQFGNRALLHKNIRAGKTIILNAGIYHIVSRYGDINAVVKGDVTVEAGKVTRAKLRHDAAHVTFKLVTQENGEALPDVQWELISSVGEVLKQMRGALPNLILKPGSYTVKATQNDTIFEKKFTLTNGQSTFIEVLTEIADQ